MKYSNVGKVFQLSEEMEDLIKKRNRVEAGSDSFLGVTLHGTYQDPTIVDEVRPAVVEALNKRINQLHEKLLELGVTAD